MILVDFLKEGTKLGKGIATGSAWAEGRGTSEGVGVGTDLGKSEIGKSEVVWSKGKGGRSELDKAGVGSKWLGESRIKVVIGSTRWET